MSGLRSKRPKRRKRRRFPEIPKPKIYWLGCHINVISMTDVPPTAQEAERAAEEVLSALDDVLPGLAQQKGRP
jgi:hypothetical protein